MPKSISWIIIFAWIFIFQISLNVNSFSLDVIDPDEEFMQELLGTQNPIPLEDAENRVIEDIRIALRDVFEENRDIYPTFLNVLHFKTKKQLIERELIFEVGDSVNIMDIEETLRNLRDLYIFSEIRIFPVEGENGGVFLYIIAKDMWALRASLAPEGGGGQGEMTLWADHLNLFGWGKFVEIQCTIQSDTLILGEVYKDRQLFGTHLQFREQYSTHFNYSGEYEGQEVFLNLEYPLYSRHIPLGFEISYAMYQYVKREYYGSSIRLFNDNENMEYEYDIDHQYLEINLAQSWGSDYKLDLFYGLGWKQIVQNKDAPDPGDEYYQDNYDRYLQDLADYSNFVSQVLEETESNKYIFATVKHYHITLTPVVNFLNFGFEEQIEKGYKISLTLSYNDKALFSSHTYFYYYIWFQYTAFIQDNYISVYLASKGKYNTVHWEQKLQTFSLTYYTPCVIYGRFAFKILINNGEYLNDDGLLYIGGDNYLRGYKANFAYGEKRIVGRAEFRTLPEYFLSTYWGFVFFVDAAGAANTWKEVFPLYVSGGLGIRITFPQFTRSLFRLDLGYPIIKPDEYPDIWEQISFSFSHTF